MEGVVAGMVVYDGRYPSCLSQTRWNLHCRSFQWWTPWNAPQTCPQASINCQQTWCPDIAWQCPPIRRANNGAGSPWVAVWNPSSPVVFPSSLFHWLAPLPASRSLLGKKDVPWLSGGATWSWGFFASQTKFNRWLSDNNSVWLQTVTTLINQVM